LRSGYRVTLAFTSPPPAANQAAIVALPPKTRADDESRRRRSAPATGGEVQATMAMGFREQRRRARRRLLWSVIRWVAAFGVVGGAGYVAYVSGAQLAEQDVDALKAEVGQLEATIEALRRQTIEQLADVEAKRLEAEHWQQRYQLDVPTGEIKGLFDLMRGKLDGGVSPQRVRFVLEAVANNRDCDRDVTTKRFVVRTPIYRGGDDAVRFADGAITVSATGISTRTEDGRAEAWFDAGSEISLKVAHIGGGITAATGPLPLRHAMVIDDQEHQFNVVASARGFVEVSHRTCRFP